MRASAFFLLLLLFAACDTGTQEQRSYSRTILREADTDFEASLILAAEAIDPPRDSVLAAAPNPELVPETDFWYYDLIDGTRVPYAITDEAVAYYADLIDALRNGGGPRSFLEAELDYLATISFEETYTFEGVHPTTQEPLPSESFEDVYVVEMELTWFQYCGPVCAAQFSHLRTVIFDAEGALLRVFGDGAILILVS